MGRHSKPSVAVRRPGKLRVRVEGDPYDVLLRLPLGSMVMVDGRLVDAEDEVGRMRVRRIEIHVPESEDDTVVKVRTRPIEAESGAHT